MVKVGDLYQRGGGLDGPLNIEFILVLGETTYFYMSGGSGHSFNDNLRSEDLRRFGWQKISIPA